MSQTITYIGLGSNLGDRQRFIEDALKMLSQTAETEVIASTEPIETVPLAGLDQPRYLNAVAELRTNLSAENFHRRLVEIENAFDRTRGRKWSSRNIDLDLLLFGSEIINTDTLIIPHPQMHLRWFVLGGLCRLNKKVMHPVLNETVEELGSRLNGCNFAPLKGKPRLVSIAGNIGAGKTTLTRKLAEVLSCRAIFEQYDKNPYLPRVYAGEKGLALDSQLYFLASRLEQLSPALLEKGKPVVCDYVFQKELIYANVLLSKEQLESYQKTYAQKAPGVVAPALLLCLADSPQRCLERIHQRNRPYEQQIQLSFLRAIDAGYKKLVAGWKLSPVITLNDFDCLSKKSVDRLAGQTGYYLNPSDTYEGRENN